MVHCTGNFMQEDIETHPMQELEEVNIMTHQYINATQNNQ